MPKLAHGHYSKIAADVIERLLYDHLDMDRFLPILMAALKHQTHGIITSGADYEIEDITWAENQERDAALFLAGLDDAIGELSVVTHYGEATTDHLDMGHIKSAESTLRNLKRRLDANSEGGGR